MPSIHYIHNPHNTKRKGGVGGFREQIGQFCPEFSKKNSVKEMGYNQYKA